MLGEYQAIAAIQTVNRLWIVGLKRHLAEQIKLVRLPDVLARQPHDSLPQIRLRRAKESQKLVDFRLIAFVERFINELRNLACLESKLFTGLRLLRSKVLCH